MEAKGKLIERGRRVCGNHSWTFPELFQGKTVWKGTIEVFDLIGHPFAKLAHAWGHAAHDTGNEVRIVTILGLPPVDSPRKAVQVSIVADSKRATT